ncbi:hypothetical protein P3T22_002502 [Paraburkholderia sp. GAS348]|uniref:Uncharacterized protein n=1 Tax=Paraburkholderia phytofirmans OLGA172 TaxID=1417228 RepID=A0A160FIN0_9BURK|nr:hypothetical protein AYM40_04620 [Paraburkholderia phytofirmans OLGA172]
MLRDGKRAKTPSNSIGGERGVAIGQLVVLEQVRTVNKSNEIAAIPQLLAPKATSFGALRTACTVCST